ncbi:FAD-dependent oxidoreductase [Phormidium sp. CCY1219]|uniref:FAD-dependent oxidoreductase n=1 Tax=Phormidium sp. CCY1219 TaxID=2886104 RepID=UPI002D1F21C9|nr:FAD-dependent oxidoreductase [Phormidium sp. CCY1219]MEB3831243.1 FAD-dependent oxidoreductase [Phormidium sp. CCY1219]
MQRQVQRFLQRSVQGLCGGKSAFSLCLSLISIGLATSISEATPPRPPEKEESCEILVVGGGLAGAATAYEALLAGRTVCMSEITDWVGGQISSQGTSALDERPTQRRLLFYPRGYLEFRSLIKEEYNRLNPGQCWVSESCFLPEDGHQLLFEELQKAAKKGKGTLKWYPNTVIKELEIARGSNGGEQIQSAIAIQHQPAPGTPPLNTEPLSQTIEDAYRYQDSPRFEKTIIRFVPLRQPEATDTSSPGDRPADWYVVDATETGEIIALADVPYRLGIDPRSPFEPSSSSTTNDPYCTQGFTYTFAMQATEDPQPHVKPPFYDRYAPYYSYELERLANFTLVYTYRRIWSAKYEKNLPSNPREYPIHPGDISMQNWTWGNDYRPGNPEDNLIYTRQQLIETGQLEPGGWMGGLRTATLQAGEEHAKGFFYWLVRGTTDSQLGEGVKQPHPNHRYLSGLDSPMGTAHGLSKYPYMREGRRIIGRPGWGHPDGFTVWEIDISRADYSEDFYRLNLLPEEYRRLWESLGGLETVEIIREKPDLDNMPRRSRSTIYPDSVGIAHYAIDFHPCMTLSPPETPGNTEREGERRGAGTAYPFQIPLRALIPQRIDNLLVAGKSIATSHIAAAAYRVHSFEWSAGAAAGTTAAFALEKGLLPYQLVDDLPQREPALELLQKRLVQNGNPISFPNTSIFNNSWEDWK